jgi:IS4 transposase
VIAADGSMFELAGEVAWALVSRQPRREDRPLSQARLDLQLDVQRFVPVDVHVAGAEEGSEVDAVGKHLRSGVVYVLDRAYVNFRFINDVLQKDSNLVLRLRTDTLFTVKQAAGPLSQRDREAGVLSDELGTLGSDAPNRAAGRTMAPPTQIMRRIRVHDDRSGKTIVLLTDLIDLPAFVIAALYRLRWQIELFFRWFKVFAAMDHCISFSPRGITTQFYVAIIGTLLIHLYTGRRVSKYQLFAVQQIASGHRT